MKGHHLATTCSPLIHETDYNYYLVEHYLGDQLIGIHEVYENEAKNLSQATVMATRLRIAANSIKRIVTAEIPAGV